jgi:glutathione S-transferase
MMKLRYSPTSPYVRKVTVVAIETGLHAQIERIPTDVRDPGTDLVRDNPLCKVPTLITEGGEALYDSPVICEYLDSLHEGLKLFPASGGARWTALRRQALADGILDSGVLIRFESLRPEQQQSAGWVERQKAAIERGLDTLEEEAPSLAGQTTIGHIAIGCALEFLDFRFPQEGWRRHRPELARWLQAFGARKSMIETRPREPA